MSHSASAGNRIDEALAFNIAAHQGRLNAAHSRFHAVPYSNNTPLEVILHAPKSQRRLSQIPHCANSMA
jgi:hypothetical protein